MPHQFKGDVDRCGAVVLTSGRETQERSPPSEMAGKLRLHPAAPALRAGKARDSAEDDTFASRDAEAGFHSGQSVSVNSSPGVGSARARAVASVCSRNAEKQNRRRDAGATRLGYSWRRATIGSTRMARRAGSQQARSAMAMSARATAAKVNGSVGATPKSIAVKRRVKP